MKNAKIALMLPEHSGSTKDNSRLKSLFDEFDMHGFISELVQYSDEKIKEVEAKLNTMDLVMVWVNPIQNGKDRKLLDTMLSRVASNGVFVSTHPDTILKIGTKDVLYTTRNMDWGGDIYRYKNKEELKSQLPKNLKKGSRVIKQYRGNGGNGIWRVELQSDGNVRILHALRNSIEEYMALDKFYDLMNDYEMLIDQPFTSPMPDGMIRAYMSLDKVVGFGHQYVTALVWPENPNEPLHPDPRLYYPNTKKEFQNLKKLLEEKWIIELQKIHEIKTEELPIIWDADFLIDNSEYKLCEINVSSVYPFPDSAISEIVKTVLTL